MATINLTLLGFLISHRVPGGCPYLFTFTSHLSEPWDTSSDGEERVNDVLTGSMLPSLAPMALSMASSWRVRAYSRASSGDLDT